MSHFFLVLVLLLCIDAFTQEHSKLSDYDVRHMFIVKILISSLRKLVHTRRKAVNAKMTYRARLTI
jgi:hypothetical protein